MSSDMSRRKFLKDAVKSLGAIGISPALAELVIGSISRSSAHAASTSASLSQKIYIYLTLPGGPPRWMFDLPLTPNGNSTTFSDSFSHSGLGTFVGVQSPGDPQTIYRPWYDPTSKLWLPPVWASNPQGGTFSRALSHAAFIRGIDLEVDNHDLGSIRGQSPIAGGLSIGGLLAGRTNTPLPAATFGLMARAFKSDRNIPPIGLELDVYTGHNPISAITGYFSGRAPSSTSGAKKVLTEFDRYATEHSFNQTSLLEAKDKSDSLIISGVQKFQDQWDSVYAKYQFRVSEAMLPTNTSYILDSKTIPLPKPLADGKTDPRVKTSSTTFLAGMSDLRNLINTKTTVSRLASLFATIEILITNSLTQVITSEVVGGIENISVDGNGGKFNCGNDQHEIGSLVATIATTYYFRAILSCTEELVYTLQSRGLFDRTLIQFGSEFNRKPRVDGSGSDHGHYGSSSLLISGMIAKTLVLGNTQTDTNPNYLGTWGAAAKHPLTGTTYPIRLNDLSRTVCAMLGIPNVTNNGTMILKASGGFWEAFPGNLGEAKNV